MAIHNYTCSVCNTQVEFETSDDPPPATIVTVTACSVADPDDVCTYELDT